MSANDPGSPLGSPAVEIPKVFLLTNPERQGLDNEIMLATLSPLNMYNQIENVMKKYLVFNSDADRDAYNLNDEVDRHPDGRDFRTQLQDFLAGEVGTVGAAGIYSVTLEFSVTYEDGQVEIYQLIASKVERQDQGGGRRRKVKRTRKSRK